MSDAPPEPILQFFAWQHLKDAKLQCISKAFADLAHNMCAGDQNTVDTVDLPRNPERTVALRKLLEAKDAAVRAALFK